MIATLSESAEVIYPNEEVVVLNRKDLTFLKQQAFENLRKRIRFCTHNTPAHALHEMFIIHTDETYVRPHKHMGKAESFYLLEGQADVILFNDDGGIRQVISMGEPKTGLPFYYRIADPIFHTLIVRTKFLVFHEVTTGPFDRNQTVFADWSVPDLNLNDLLEKNVSTIIEKMMQPETYHNRSIA